MAAELPVVTIVLFIASGTLVHLSLLCFILPVGALSLLVLTYYYVYCLKMSILIIMVIVCHLSNVSLILHYWVCVRVCVHACVHVCVCMDKYYCLIR